MYVAFRIMKVDRTIAGFCAVNSVHKHVGQNTTLHLELSNQKTRFETIERYKLEAFDENER
jgi:hypothetical protein